MSTTPAAFTAGQRVRFVGTFGNADGPTGKVWRVTAYGVWVTFPDGRQLMHPEDIAVVVSGGGTR